MNFKALRFVLSIIAVFAVSCASAPADINRSSDLGVTPLMTASQKGDPAEVIRLIGGGASLNATDYSKKSALIMAVENNKRDVSKLLIKAGADVNVQSNMGQTALIYSVKTGDVRIAQALLQAGANPDIQDYLGKTALIYATTIGHGRIIHLLITSGASLDIEDTVSKTPLMYAVEGGNPKIVGLLIDGGADKNKKNDLGQTALSQSAGRGNDSITKLLIKEGGSAKEQDRFKRTPLMIAALNGHTGTIKELLQSGADINAQDHLGNSPLIIASRAGHLKAVAILLNANANINMIDNKGHTALMRASQKGATGVVKELIKAGAKLDVINKGGMTAISFASREGYIQTIKVLAAAGANINLHDKKGMTALAYAARGGLIKTVAVLLGAGAGAKSMDKGGVTALAHAAKGGYIDIIIILLKAGAKPIQGKEKTKQPWFIAKSMGHIKAYSLLKDTELMQRASGSISADEMTILLFEATKHGASKTVEKLLRKGTDVNHKSDFPVKPASYFKEHERPLLELFPKGYGISDKDFEQITCADITPLHLAALLGRFEVMKALIMNGAQIDAKDTCGRTPLVIASAGTTIDPILLLLTHGASPEERQKLANSSALILGAKEGTGEAVRALAFMSKNKEIKDKFGLTALHWAAIKGDVTKVTHLIDNRAYINANDKLGNTPLHWAAIRKLDDIVTYLLSRGADVDAKSGDGKTPMEMVADKPGYENTAKLLEEYKGILGRSAQKQESASQKDSTQNYLLLRQLFKMEWAKELYTSDSFCSYKTLEGPKFRSGGSAAKATIECIRVGGTDEDQADNNDIAYKRVETTISVNKKEDYNKVALSACGCL